MSSLNLGENGTLQHSWDFSDWKTTLTQFYFQLVRNSFEGKDMPFVFGRLLDQSLTNDTLRNYLMRIVIHTRDIKKGKGERDLFYSLLRHLSTNGFLGQAMDILRYTCNNDSGSWKDIKYLVHYLIRDQLDITNLEDAPPLARGALQLLSARIEEDYKAYNEDRFKDMSLAARWAPRREKGKFAPVTRLFVQTIHSSRRYTSSSMRDVRKMLALLNRDLNTPQIDMCRGTWRLLKFNSMTSYTLLKNKLAFQNKTKVGDTRSSKDDRVECADHYVEWLNSKDKKMNVSTIYPYELVRDVSGKLLNAEEQKYYNDAWKAQLNVQLEATKDSYGGIMIPMIDVSGSMSCDNSLPMFNAIALGIRLSEMTTGVFHNKALTFEESPSWAEYRDDQTFFEKVHMTQRLGWGGSTNFTKALKKVLTEIITHRLSPLAVKNSSIVVFSDMQMNQSSRTPYRTVYERMVGEYHRAGMESIYGQPYEVPHIVFWNLRKTNGFPNIVKQTGVTMISGYNASMIEVLLNKGSRALREMTSWDLLRDVLSQDRFDHTT